MTDSISSSSASGQRTAALALLLGTVFWGCGFTWAKAGGEAVHKYAAGLPDDSTFGPVFLLAWRFLIGGVAWLILFPEARRNWTLPSVARSAGVGVLLALGLLLQHVGLDQTTEAVSAFLTSLTILFVPLLMTFAMKKPPKPILWVGVALATFGVWMLTGAHRTGLGAGEWLGLGCALAFSLYILAVNAAVARDIPWRITAGQFLTVGAVCFIYCGCIQNGGRNLWPHAMAGILQHPSVYVNLLLLSAFPTIAAFGLLTHFQPRLDPTRAAMLYLMEPIVAVIYAMIAVGHIPTWMTGAGAGCILIANMIVEILSSRKAVMVQPAVID